MPPTTSDDAGVWREQDAASGLVASTVLYVNAGLKLFENQRYEIDV
jgi:hypothetical protein